MPPVLDNYHKILIDCFEAFLFEFLFLIYNFEKNPTDRSDVMVSK